MGKLDGERAIVAEESVDDGRSWNAIGTVSHPPETAHRGLGEPHLVETASGKLVGLFRVGGGDMSERFLYQADSEDGGRTWTPARVTPMLGFPPHLIRLQDDRLLVVYGRRLSPYGQRTCLSSDEGATWEVESERVVQAAPTRLASTAQETILGQLVHLGQHRTGRERSTGRRPLQQVRAMFLGQTHALV